jgi:hypothetical protein
VIIQASTSINTPQTQKLNIKHNIISQIHKFKPRVQVSKFSNIGPVFVGLLGGVHSCFRSPEARIKASFRWVLRID